MIKPSMLCLCFFAGVPMWAAAQSEAPATQSGRFAAGDGTNVAPAYSFSSAPGVGFYKRRDGDGLGFLFAAGGKKGLIALTSGSLALESNHELIWSSVSNVDNLNQMANDVRLARDGAGILSIKGGGSPGLRLYGIYNGSSTANFERFAINTAPGAVVLRTEAAGSGSVKALQVGTGANPVWIFDAQGNFGRGSASPKTALCGGTATVEGRDSAMVVTVGRGTGTNTCSVSFGTAWAAAPSCVANSSADAEPLLVSTTAGGVRVNKATPFTAGSKLHIHCAGV